MGRKTEDINAYGITTWKQVERIGGAETWEKGGKEYRKQERRGRERDPKVVRIHNTA